MQVPASIQEVFSIIDQIPEISIVDIEADTEPSCFLNILYAVPNLWKTNKLTESAVRAKEIIYNVRVLCKIYDLDFKELVRASLEHKRDFHKSILLHAWNQRPRISTTLRDGLIRALSASISPSPHDFLYAIPLLKSLIPKQIEDTMEADSEGPILNQEGI